MHLSGQAIAHAEPTAGSGTDLTLLTLSQASAKIHDRQVTAMQLTEAVLARISAIDSSLNSYITVTGENAIADARRLDKEQRSGKLRGPLHGIPIALKDNIDTVGIPTTAASAVYRERIPVEDAEVTRRLKQAGAIIVGKLNLHEFAAGGTGHASAFGATHNPWDLERVTGGSSSGSGGAVAGELCFGALGTDTGGSCRIPAAYNGIVGFKPTQRRVPLDGGVPLSFSLDSFGPIARTVGCCAVLDAVLADEPVVPLQPRPIKGMRLAVPTTTALDELEDAVARTFDRALETLSRHGALIERIAVPEFHDVAQMNAKGGFSAAESYAWHRYLIASKGDIYDPRVASRIMRGESQSAADYVDLLDARRSLIARIAVRLAPYDALVMPTTANTPPRIADLVDDDKAFTRANVLALRNCSLINVIDGCAISLPAHRDGEVPVGLMLAATGGADRRIFELAAGIEAVIGG